METAPGVTETGNLSTGEGAAVGSRCTFIAANGMSSDHATRDSPEADAAFQAPTR